jgi:hypothetical protein
VDEEEEEELLDIVKFNNNRNESEAADEETKYQPASGVKPLGFPAKSKSFPCRLCSKVFVRQDHLARHMSVHAGSKPFSCQLCSKGFKHEDRLKQHLVRAHDITTMTDNASLRCSCGLEFKQEYDFYDHLSANPQHELATTAETKPSGDGEDTDGDVKFELAENDIKQEPSESGSLAPKLVEKSVKLKRGRPGKKAGKKPAGSTAMTKVKKKTTHVCKYCKEGFASIVKRKQHYLDAHWSELNEKGLLFTRNNSLRQNCRKNQAQPVDF